MIVINGSVSDEIKQNLMSGGTHPVARRHGNLIVAGGNFAEQLPAEYTRLTYIKSTGKQWINTGVEATSIKRFVVKATCTEQSGTNTQLIGTNNNSSTSFFGARCYSGVFWYCSDNGVFYGNPHNLSVIDATIESATSQHGTLKDLVENTTVRFTSLSSSAGGTWGFTSGNLRIFGGDSTRVSPNATCYSLKLYTSSGLARDFVPCKRNKDGVVGMYDTVTKAFFTNSGSGTFVAGT